MTPGCTVSTRIEGGARHEGGCEAPALGGGSGANRGWRPGGTVGWNGTRLG